MKRNTVEMIQKVFTGNGVGEFENADCYGKI